MDSYYEVLGVSVTASDEEIKAAYCKLKKELDPAQCASDALRDLLCARTKLIDLAYTRIRDERENARWDVGWTEPERRENHQTPVVRIELGEENGPEQVKVLPQKGLPTILKVLLRILAAPLALIALAASCFVSFITTIAGWFFALLGGGIGIIALVAIWIQLGAGAGKDAAETAQVLFLGFGIFMIPVFVQVIAEGLAGVSSSLIKFVLTGSVTSKIE